MKVNLANVSAVLAAQRQAAHASTTRKKATTTPAEPALQAATAPSKK